MKIKYFSTLILLMINQIAIGQIDTIFVNKNNNVNIVFESPIQRAYTGNNYYSLIFEQNVDKILVLKAVEGPDSNLFVLTEDNFMYNFIIAYKENLREFYKLIDITKAINYTGPVEQENKETSDTDNAIKKDTVYNLQSVHNVKNLYENDKQAAMKKVCVSLTTQDHFYARSIVLANNISLQLMNIVNNKNELYFYFEIANKIGMDYDIDMFDYTLNTQSVKKRSNSQAQTITPIYTYWLPQKVKGNSKQRFVVVFEKFTVSHKKVFIMNIKEVNGERDIYIEIPSKQINNPNIY